MKNFLSTNTCNYPKDSKIYDSQNEMVVGKMKIAYKGIQINKFVGLKSKMHSMLSDDGKESNTAKRINTAIVFNEFKACVRYFITNFHLSPSESPSITRIDGFYFIKKPFSFSRYLIFLCFHLSLFFLPVSHCFRA